MIDTGAKYVQVVDCSGEAFWYRDKIGKVFEVTGYEDEDYVVRFGTTINSHWIKRQDCCVVSGVPVAVDVEQEEYTGASVSYYAAEVVNPTNPDSDPYTAECNDIIEALGMTFAEGNAFKAIWRSCAARKFGKAKKGYDSGLYDAEKVVFFGERMVVSAKMAKEKVDVEGNR